MEHWAVEGASHDGAADPAGRRRARWTAALLAAVAAVLLAALVVLVQRTEGERDRALARAQHSFAVVLLIDQVQGSIARAEASLGRFVIDADPRTGQFYYDDWRQAGDLIRRLGLLVADNPAQAQQVATLRQLYSQRGAELAEVSMRAAYKQGMPSLSFYYKAARSPVLPRLARALQQIAESEDSILDRRATTAAVRLDRSNNYTRLLSLVGVLLALTVVALAWAVADALADRRVARDLAEVEADRAALLAQAVEARTAELVDANERLRLEAETREAAESRLRQVQKMDAVGQLTGGIAHDFNNMLAVVLGGLEGAKRRLAEQVSETNRQLDQALEGAERASALTRRLLSFARAEPLLPSAVAPDRLLGGMADLLQRTLGERIAVRIRVAAECWPVWIDGYQLENAVLNLAVNARDAMPHGGTLGIAAANVRLAAGEVGALPAGDYLRVEVTDTGSGMPPAILDRVFEPFFTTKPVGQGTGLGLSQILGFARQSKGDVAIRSAPGQGTAVAILLPRHHLPAGTARIADLPRPATNGGAPAAVALAGPVVMVEDDPRVRAATAAALADLGVQVESFASGDAALARLCSAAPPALLMTDVVMPDMNGVDLVRLARTALPDLPVLFMTGYVGEAADADAFEGALVLRKPFTLAALATALTQAVA